MKRRIRHNIENDGIDRRGFLECMAWAGSGVLYTFAGGVASSRIVSGQEHAHGGAAADAQFTFAQISDSHMGFKKEPNLDVTGTLRTALAKIKTLPSPPDFLVHTGDITHLSKPEEFDVVSGLLQESGISTVFFVPGEHDVLTDEGRYFRERYGKGSAGDGWFSFDHRGVHCVGLVNVLNLKAGGLGSLGEEQIRWLEADLAGRPSSTPIVIFAHVPLWTVYEDWGWGTEDGARALALVRRFGSVTVLNGHIHQTMRKVEGQITFHTAASTAFPQPQPGSAPSPGPLKVPSAQLKSYLGLTEVRYTRGQRALAVMDSTLESSNGRDVRIDNFAFSPAAITVAAGIKVTWVNGDDIPHTVVSNTRAFASPVLDTDDKFTHVFDKPGEFPYYCSIHPKMTGTVRVKA